MSGERLDQGIYYDNLGVSYSAGVFTVHGSDGRDLSASNPAVVIMPSRANPCLFKRYNITSNQSFEDAGGTSDIIGNLFGWTTSVAITVDVPFFLVAVVNDTETAVAFGLCRLPHLTISPASANIGTPAGANADIESSVFLFNSVTTTLYDANPMICLGSIRMRMDASDDWTVQTLDYTYDGIGNFQQNNEFQMPLGQNGANAGTVTVNNGGVAPVFTTTTTRYTISKEGYCNYNVFLDGDSGTDGTGAVTARFSSPFLFENASILNNYGVGQVSFAGGSSEVSAVHGNTLSTMDVRTTADGVIQWADFANGTRNVSINIWWKLQTI